LFEESLLRLIALERIDQLHQTLAQCGLAIVAILTELVLECVYLLLFVGRALAQRSQRLVKLLLPGGHFGLSLLQ